MFLKHLFFLAAIVVPSVLAQTPTPKLAHVCLIDVQGHPVPDMPLFAHKNGDAELARTGADGCTSVDPATAPKMLWVTGVQTWLDRQFRVPTAGATRRIIIKHDGDHSLDTVPPGRNDLQH